MRWTSLLFALIVALLLTGRPALGCPSCQEAIPNGSGQEELDQMRLARAYNHSIYLMVGMPYLMLGVVGFMVYRHLRVHSSALPMPGQPAPTLRAEEHS